jgi:hypothetical protein
MEMGEVGSMIMGSGLYFAAKQPATALGKLVAGHRAG